MSPTDGCEVDTTDTKSHCGSCNHACTNADDTCVASACTTPCGVLPNTTDDFLCWVYTGPGTVGTGYVGLRGGINQDVDPFNNSAGCINPSMGASNDLCDLGTPAGSATILAIAGIHSGDTQFSGTVAGTFACDTVSCQGTVVGYKVGGVECGSIVNNVISGTCLSLQLDASINRLVVKFAP